MERRKNGRIKGMISISMLIPSLGEACLPSNAYYPRTPDYTLYSGGHVCWSEHSDSSFVYGFMSLDYGLGTMTVTTYTIQQVILNVCTILF